ncbi:MAG TPA: hypothetical protein VF021_00765 [Longimicrobiales bacterium]
MNRRFVMLIPMFLTATLALTACDGGARAKAEQRAKAAETRLAQMDEISATKDSLVKEMMATTSFINELNDAVSKVKNTKGKTVTYEERVMPVGEFRATLLSRIDSLVKRLDESETRLKASQARLNRLAGKDSQMTGRLVRLDSMVTRYRLMIEDQRGEIAQLTTRVDSLQTNNTRLASQNTELTTQVTDLTTFANRVYYVIGNKAELMKNGVATQAGGSRVLGIGWRTGETLVPARELNESSFTPIVKNVDFDIKLPRADKKYAIVSPQNLKYVEPQPDKDGTFRDGFRITNPDAFWSASKYLIVVEK